MITAGRKEMMNLFSERNRSIGFVSFPSSSTQVDDKPASLHQNQLKSGRRSLTPTPARRHSMRIAAPSSRTYEVVSLAGIEAKLQEYLSGVLDSLAEVVDRMFNDTSLYNTYWNAFFHTLLFNISGGLVVRPGHVRSEAEVRYNLVKAYSEYDG